MQAGLGDAASLEQGRDVDQDGRQPKKLSERGPWEVFSDTSCGSDNANTKIITWKFPFISLDFYINLDFYILIFKGYIKK